MRFSKPNNPQGNPVIIGRVNPTDRDFPDLTGGGLSGLIGSAIIAELQPLLGFGYKLLLFHTREV